jgi:predicted NUDIX family NTP pyrophosphohydrolase
MAVLIANRSPRRRLPGASAALVDRAEWFTLDDARDKIIKGQSVFLDRLEQILRPMPSI